MTTKARLEMYAVTKAGHQAWASQDVAIPEQYRRFLWTSELLGMAQALQTLASGQPAHLVRDWINELLELGFIERSSKAPKHVRRKILDKAALEAGAVASKSLESVGVYLAPNPARKRGREKPPADTTILIVEDDPDQLALADLRVSMAGYKVRVAASVDELITSLLRDGIPDLLLLDVNLPDGNGFDVLAKIRTHRRTASMPVIMLTVERGANEVGKGLVIGADGYVTKPYSKRVLADAIKSVLGNL